MQKVRAAERLSLNMFLNVCLVVFECTDRNNNRCTLFPNIPERLANIQKNKDQLKSRLKLLGKLPPFTHGDDEDGEVLGGDVDGDVDAELNQNGPWSSRDSPTASEMAFYNNQSQKSGMRPSIIRYSLYHSAVSIMVSRHRLTGHAVETQRRSNQGTHGHVHNHVHGRSVHPTSNNSKTRPTCAIQ